jgi:outer membrane receptor for monomeric catechols
VDDAVSQQQTFAWLRQDLALSDRVRLELGLRADVFRFGVTDRLAAANGAVDLSVARWDGLLSPKANLAIALSPRTTLFLNAGLGFHSNDARDVVAAPRDSVVIPRAFGSEVGARHFWSGGSVAAALWLMDLQSELVYNGDEGTTEPSGRTRRYGLDLEGRVRLAGWLWADADLNLSHGRFRDAPAGFDLIPLAPTVTSTGGLTVRALRPLEGGVRYRYVGSRAADSSSSIVAKGYILGEVFATWHAGRVDLVLTVDNLLDATWNEAQFATTSRLRGEPSPITELNFTPGLPRSVQVGARYRY